MPDKSQSRNKFQPFVLLSNCECKQHYWSLLFIVNFATHNKQIYKNTSNFAPNVHQLQLLYCLNFIHLGLLLTPYGCGVDADSHAQKEREREREMFWLSTYVRINLKGHFTHLH